MTYIAGTFARELADELYAVYVSMKTGAYQIDHADIAKRDLRNVCLGYLALDEDKAQADKRVSQQYAQADNMTDSLAALTAAVKAALPCRDKLLADYDNKWHQDGLVMDKWFILQATRPDADVLDNVKSLLTHRSFTMANPNRVRSLVGAFVMNNPKAFHDKSGKGYEFLTEILCDLNSRNPQVASRLIEPLIRLKRYDDSRQSKMRDALLRLKGLENLSGDLFEKITKALDEN